MPGPISVNKRTYLPYGAMVPPAGGAGFAGPLEDRGFMSPKKSAIRLKQTHGVYLTLGGRNILFAIDAAAAPPGSKAWEFIHKVLAQLEAAYPKLDAGAQTALGKLEAVVFAASPSRSFAQVDKSTFFSDTDEFQRADGSWITPAYSASCIVHDANHVLLHKKGIQHWGQAAEEACWKVQVANRLALGLDATETAFLQDLIDHPEKAKARMEAPAF